jgi:hypothetical protein
MVSIGSPLTPAASSSYSDDDPRPSMRPAMASPRSPDVRRLSVHSLLSGPPGPSYHRSDGGFGLPPSSGLVPETDTERTEASTFHGYDLGQKDEDVGKNDDGNAISRLPPPTAAPGEVALGCHNGGSPVEFGFGVQSNNPTRAGGYYDKPVPIRIPKSLEPLPSKYVSFL